MRCPFKKAPFPITAVNSCTYIPKEKTTHEPKHTAFFKPKIATTTEIYVQGIFQDKHLKHCPIKNNLTDRNLL
jgi:hypothetical protein